MSRRDDILVEMLKRYHEALDPSFGRSGIPGDGEGYPHLPSTWNSSYRELERCLVWLRDEKPSAFHHLAARWLNRVEGVRLLRVLGGRVQLGDRMEVGAGQVASGDAWARLRVFSWPDWVSERLAREGLALVSREFRGEPFIPREFQDAGSVNP